MRLRAMLRALRLIGPREALRAVGYTLFRDRLDFRLPPAGPFLPPGNLLVATPVPGGGRFRFARGELEVRFLAPDLVRITWKGGPLPIPYAIARDDWPPVQVSWDPADGGYDLGSEELEVIVGTDGGLLFRDAAGRILRRESPPRRRGQEWVHRADLRPGEHLYGLGERAAPLNLRGGEYCMWNSDPLGGYGPGVDPLYLGIPVYLGLHPEGSYLLFYENSYRAVFRFRDRAQAWFSGGCLRYYFIPGPPDRALRRYTELTGRPSLPPRWALGYHQSRWGYRTQEEIRSLREKFQAHDLPLSAIHLDIDYMDGFRVFTVDRERFPDLAGLARELADGGVHLVAILDPGVKRDKGYDLFREGLEAGHFCTLPGGKGAKRPLYAQVWPGWCAFPDFTDPAARSWWGDQYPRLLQLGIAGFWHDMNEPSVRTDWGDSTFPLPTRHALEGRGGDHREAHNLYGLLMNRAACEGLRRHCPEKRPFLLSRSGWAGLQRYAWNWTGDTESTWETLRQTVPTVLGLGLSGIPYTGPDIGGFSGHPSAELYIRWFQLAAFLPFFRTHSAWDVPPREPWTFGEPALSIVRNFLRLRYRLLPYLYTLAWETSRTGHPLVRPLFWPDGRDPAFWDVQDAFFLGEALLVAPALEEGARSRQVTLPAGRWYDFWDDTPYDGPGTVLIPAPLERIPLLVRAGSILPMEEDGRLALHLYPPEGGEGGGMLYSDAGDGYGPWRVDRFRLHRSGEALEMSWETEGDYPFPWPGVRVLGHGLRSRRIRLDGREYEPARMPVEAGPFRVLRLEG